jgi:PDZ domain-containing protein
VPDGLQVFRTGTLEESLDILEVVADGGDTSKLPVCTANR